MGLLACWTPSGDSWAVKKTLQAYEPNLDHILIG